MKGVGSEETNIKRAAEITPDASACRDTNAGIV
jgi:hypothetical protein